MGKCLMMTEDEQVISMVNRSTDQRQRVKENRQLLSDLDRRRRVRAEHEHRVAVMQAAAEIGMPAATGVLILAAMLYDLVAAALAVPVAAVCFGFAAIRTDRIARRWAE